MFYCNYSIIYCILRHQGIRIVIVLTLPTQTHLKYEHILAKPVVNFK